MTKEEFFEAILANRIRSDAFSLGDERNECYVIADRGPHWEVFYAERGQQTGVRRFATESAALDQLLAVLRSDISARH